MFSHVTVGTRDLARAASFYDALLSPIGLVQRIVVPDGGPPAACWIDPAEPLPRFFVYVPFDGNLATPGNGTMIGFLAASLQAVDQAYAAGMALGGTDEGAPGPRERYGKGYYGMYLRDPDGNKIHIAYRGDLLPE